jgi:hypothetical protein
MICGTIARTIMLSQVGFPTINRHQRPYPVPMFVRYPRHRRQSVPSPTICATGLDLGYGVSSAPPAAIRVMTGIRPIDRDMRHQRRFAQGLSRK